MTGPHPSRNSYWIIEGSFAAGEYPGDKDLARAKGKFESLLDKGIDQFIDLTESWDGLEPYARIAERLAIDLDRIVTVSKHPIRDQSIPRAKAQMTAILDDIDAALGNGRRVYVHCWGGVGRTGTVVGCWLVRHGASGDAALSQVDRWWRGMPKAVRRWDSPENDEQKDFVRNWSEAEEPQQTLFSWAEFMAEEPVKPKRRKSKPQPAGMSMLEWAMELEREREKEPVGARR